MKPKKQKPVKKAKFVKREVKKKEEKKPTPVTPVEGGGKVLMGKQGKKMFGTLRGMHDILPKEEKYWRAIYHAAESLATYYQFGRLETPTLEEANLFVRGIGKGTDVVDKEMYTFEDRDGTRVGIRPEGTAGAVRAYLNNGMWNQTQPIKMWYWESMFRHERPQAGRLREHHQVGFETLGAKDPALDAELILVAYSLYKDLGLLTEVHINTLGTKEERVRYVNELTNYYRSKRAYLCDDCKMRLTKNPLRLLDCKVEGCQPVKESAPQIIDWLDESSKNYFMKVLEYLDELGVPYLLTPTLVRGLDYYTHTVFELYAQSNSNGVPGGKQGSQSALGGGGRYDLLVEELGGQPTAAAGFGMGIERAVSALKEAGAVKPINIPEPKYDIFFAQLGEEAKRHALKIINELRGTGLKPAFNLCKGSLKAQLETANNLKVPYVLILGQKEVQDKTIIIRDMESGVQEIVDQKKIEAALTKKLADRVKVL